MAVAPLANRFQSTKNKTVLWKEFMKQIQLDILIGTTFLVLTAAIIVFTLQDFVR